MRINEPTPEQEVGYREWLASRPPHVRAVAEQFEPWSLYRLKPTGQRVTIVSFGEAQDNSVTLTVLVSADFNLVMFERQVFGIKPDDLEPCDLPSVDEPTGLCERYKRGDAALHFHYFDETAERVNIGGGKLCAIINAVGFGGQPASGVNLHGGDSRLDRGDVADQGTMLVDIAEVLKDGQPVRVAAVPSRVRLQVINHCADSIAFDALYLSLVTSHLVFLGRIGPPQADWELRILGEGSGLAQNQGAGQMVEGGSQLVDGVAGNDRQERWDATVPVEILKRFQRLRIVIDQFTVRCFVNKGVEFPFQLSDVLIGPL